MAAIMEQAEPAPSTSKAAAEQSGLALQRETNYRRSARAARRGAAVEAAKALVKRRAPGR